MAAAVAATCLLRLNGQDFQAGRNFLGDDPSSAVNLQNGGQLPYRPMVSPQMTRGPYNIRLGPASAHFSASTSLAYTDNALFTDSTLGDPSDLAVTPMLMANIEWPITEMNGLRINVGIGYQKHFIQEQLDSFTLSPNSTIDWMVIAGNVRISLFNTTSTPADLMQRPELVGTGSGQTAAFRRIQNQSGLSASWILSRDMSLQAGYSYGLERSLTGANTFDALDRDSHTVNTALYRRLGPVWTVGLSASAAQQTFQTGIQNASKSYSGGVLAAWQPSRYFNASANIRYTVTDFERTGLVADNSQFAGVTYDITVTHRFRRFWDYTINAGSGVNSGYGNNFTEQLFGNASLNWSATDKLGIQLSAGFTQATESGNFLTLSRETFRISPNSFDATIPGMVDDGGGRLYYFPPGVLDLGGGLVTLPLPGRSSQMFQSGVTINYRFTTKLSGSLSYGYNIRQSDLQLRNYTQHMVSLGLNYYF